MSRFSGHPGPKRTRTPLWLRPRVAIIGLGLVFALAWLLDKSAYDALTPEWASWNNDWSRMFRVAGFLPTWALIGAAIALTESARRSLSRAWPGGAAIFISALLAGGIAEVAKMLFRRARPNATDGEHVFVAFSTDWDKGFGLPSSHAAVAFGAAFMIAMAWPRAGVLALLVAAGCGFTRMASGAHFFSDVAASALVGYVSALAISRVLPGPGGQGAGGVGGKFS